MTERERERMRILRRIAQGERRIARGRSVRLEQGGPGLAPSRVHEHAILYVLRRRLAEITNTEETHE